MSHPPAYYNTNSERGDELSASRAKARTQEEQVAALMQDGRPRTAWEILDALDAVLPPRVPITSIRRATTNLYKRGLLEKLEETRRGPLGKKAHRYRWACAKKELTLFSN